MKKPLKINNGGYHTDKNFNVVYLTLGQVNNLARYKLRLHKKFGCKKWFVLDKNSHWAISIC